MLILFNLRKKDYEIGYLYILLFVNEIIKFYLIIVKNLIKCLF